MLTACPKTFLRAVNDLRQSRDPAPATMRAAMLVAPDGFAISAESATDNVYMAPDRLVDRERAHRQHEGVARIIRGLGVPVVHFAGREGQPDGIFPNNVFGTVPGRLVVGRMFHPCRQREAGREDVRAFFRDVLRYEERDLSGGTAVAELTGSLIIDRAFGVGFHGLSNRTDERGAAAMHEAFDLGLSLRFQLVPDEYHTNIVLAILAGRVAVLYKEAFVDRAVADAVEAAYDGRCAVLTPEEKNAFVGNCISITPEDVLFSATATRAMRRETRDVLERNGLRIHEATIDELEKGGGSLRCLIAEIF